MLMLRRISSMHFLPIQHGPARAHGGLLSRQTEELPGRAVEGRQDVDGQVGPVFDRIPRSQIRGGLQRPLGGNRPASPDG